MSTNMHIANAIPPGEFIKDELDARGWIQKDFASIIERDTRTVSDLITGKRPVTTDLAILIGEAFGTSAELWLNLESKYQLALVKQKEKTESSVIQRADLFDKYPIREMKKRGWIQDTNNFEELTSEVNRFFSNAPIQFTARKTDRAGKEPLLSAWITKAQSMASDTTAESYSEIKLQSLLNELKALLMSPREITRIPAMMARAGIRFVIVEQLPTSGIDGACCWLTDKHPVVAMSIQADRIDNFWFTLMHELFHVKHKHGQEKPIIDVDMFNQDISHNENEILVNNDAAEYLVPKKELEKFINRVAPYFYSKKIIGFAARMEVHPGIVVGQLQNRGLIEYSHHRRQLEKCRADIISTSTYDGWGHIG